MCRRRGAAWWMAKAWARLLVTAAVLGAACKQIELSDQPREEPLDPSRYFEDGMSARTPVPGTIPRGGLRLDQHLYEGVRDGEPAESFPFELERSDLERGRERYDAFCAPCHGYVGDGDGMIVHRGFPRPPSLHTEHLRGIAPGRIFQAITRGAAAMPSYRAQINPVDRWRIVGYVRALQRSQFAGREDLPDGELSRLQRGSDGE